MFARTDLFTEAAILELKVAEQSEKLAKHGIQLNKAKPVCVYRYVNNLWNFSVLLSCSPLKDTQSRCLLVAKYI